MFERLAKLNQFNRAFVHYAMQLREGIAALLLMLVLGGIAIAKVEGIKLGDAVYFSFITGLSIGYGDITPKTDLGRVMSVAIGLVGVLFVGLTVAIATRALRDTAERFNKTH
jgi:hypothetical protein